MRTLRRSRLRQDERKKLHASRLRDERALSRGAACASRAPPRAGSWVTMTIVLPCSRLSAWQQLEDLVARLAIEIAGRLVAQQQRRVGDDGAGDADALFLAARQLARDSGSRARRARRRSARPGRAACDRPTRAWSAAAAARRSCAAVSTGSRLYIWKTKPMCRARQLESLPPDSLSMRSPADLDRSLGRRVEAAHQVQQRRLAGARRPHQREEVPFGNVEGDALQHVDPLVAAVVDLVQIPD